MYITSNISLRMLSRSIRTTKWTSIYETVLFPFLLVPVLMEAVGIKMKTFKVTKKGEVENERGKNLVYLIPFAVLVLLSVIGIINCLRMIFESNDMGPVVVLFWLFVNLFTLVMAMFFIMGRDYMRKSERAQVEVDCEITTKAGNYTCKTINISEEGLAVSLSQPINIDDKEDAQLRLWNERYKAVVKARVVHVDNKKKSWKYAFYINDYCDTFEEYLQLLYDRVPTLPQKLDATSGGFDDLRLNITKRAVKPFYENRQLPRVTISALLPDEKGKEWKLADFNYRFCTICMEGSMPEKILLTVNKDKRLFLECSKEKENQEAGRALYKIVNYDMISKDSERNNALETWLLQEWKAFSEEKVKEETQEKQTEKEKESSDFDEMQYV